MVTQSSAFVQTKLIRPCLKIGTCDSMNWGEHFTTVLYQLPSRPEIEVKGFFL